MSSIDCERKFAYDLERSWEGFPGAGSEWMNDDE